MRATTSLKTPICLRVSSWVDAPCPSTLPTRKRTVRHVEALTTRYFQGLLIGDENSGGLRPIILRRPLLHWTRRRPVSVLARTGYFQPIRSRNPVMCAAWWRPCQAYMARTTSRGTRPSLGWRKAREKAASGRLRASATQRAWRPSIEDKEV